MKVSLNGFFAWLLAFAALFAPIGAVAAGVASSLVAVLELPIETTLFEDAFLALWAVPSLLITGLFLRRVENFVRRVGYDLPPVDGRSQTGGDPTDEDALSTSVDQALTEAIRQEIDTYRKRPPPDGSS